MVSAEPQTGLDSQVVHRHLSTGMWDSETSDVSGLAALLNTSLRSCAPVVHYPLRFDKLSLNLVNILNCDAITASGLLSWVRTGPEKSEGALEVVAVRDFRLPNSNPKAALFALDVCLREWDRTRPWRDGREAHWAPCDNSSTIQFENCPVVRKSCWARAECRQKHL